MPVLPQKRPSPKAWEKVGPTPETAAKLQPDFLDKLVRDGHRDGGIDHQEFEILFEIEEAHTVVGKLTGARASSLEMVGGGDPTNLSDGEARTWTIWGIWATEFYRRTGVAGTKIAELIKARWPVDATFVQHYRDAAALWDKVKHDLGREKRS